MLTLMNSDEKKIAERKRLREYYLANRDAILARAKHYAAENREEVQAYQKGYRQNKLDRNKQREASRVWAKKWREKDGGVENCKRNRAWQKKEGAAYRARRNQEPEFRILKNLRRRISYALHGRDKSASTVELLGCSVTCLKACLEVQFSAGMSWENYGEWHVDHIRPCVSFDLTDPKQQQDCFHFTNLQPLWARDNFIKGDKRVVQ